METTMEPRWTTKDAAQFLGVHLHTVQEAVRAGRLPAVQKGGRIELEPAVVTAYNAGVRDEALKDLAARVDEQRAIDDSKRRQAISDARAKARAARGGAPDPSDPEDDPKAADGGARA